MINKASAFALFLFAIAAISSRAHSVWIEPNKEGQLIIRFAEPDGKFEKSPGHLDELEIPSAWKMDGAKPAKLEVQKKSDHFLIVGAKIADSVQIESRFAVMSAPGKPGRLPYFYARWNPPAAPGAAAANAALMLDLVPTGQPGEAKVFFRGKPLPEAKATFRTPDEKETPLVADKEGVIRFSSKQLGQHMLSIAHHREALPGFLGGQPYDLTSHNASLAWIEP